MLAKCKPPIEENCEISRNVGPCIWASKNTRKLGIRQEVYQHLGNLHAAMYFSAVVYSQYS